MSLKPFLLYGSTYEPLQQKSSRHERNELN